MFDRVKKPDVAIVLMNIIITCYSGKTGSIILGPTADREPQFWFWQLDDKSSEFYPYTVTEYDDNGKNVSTVHE